jgi:hypothetical membrane protein
MIPTMAGGSNRRATARAWAFAAIAGTAVYIAIDIALVFLRPEFSVLHNAESDYGSKGRYAWLMDANFLLRSALSLAAIRALALTVPGRLRTGLSVLAVWAVCSGLLAFFPDDPVGTRTTGLAKVHVALAGIAFLAVVVGTLLVTRVLRREPGWKPVARVLSVLSWAALVPIVLLGRTHFRPHSLGGFWEKVFLGIELAWFLAACLGVLAATPDGVGI